MIARMTGPFLRWSLAFSLLPAGIFVFSMGGPPKVEAADSATISMSWIFAGRHSWYFAAIENGYFKEADLAVKIIRGYGGGDTIKKLTVGSFEVAEIDAGNTVIARAKGSPVKLVSVHLIKAPFGIFSLQGSGIQKPKDLEGKLIAAGKIDAMRILFPAFAQEAGLDSSKVKWMSMIPSGKVGALKGKKVDAITGYVDTFGGALSVKGFEFQIIRFADHGFNILSNGLVTTDKVIADRASMLMGLVKAVNRGIVWTMGHQKEAIQAMSKHHPESNPKILAKQLELTEQFMGDVNRPKFGLIDRDRMKVTRDTVVKAMNLKNVSLDDVYTNRFIP